MICVKRALIGAYTRKMHKPSSRKALQQSRFMPWAIRRFLIHVLPDGFHRIRHYGLFANANRANNIALVRRLLAVPDPTPSSRASDHAENGRRDEDWNACPCCGGRMIIVEAFNPGCQPRFWPVPSIGLDSS